MRTVFVSFSHLDQQSVDDFIVTWTENERVFIPKILGVGDEDDFINSDNPEYVMAQIRSRYLEDSTVTIALIGPCTHSRRYVDWEIKASLTQGDDYLPNGLLGILLPGLRSAHLPPRFKLNWNSNEHNCYARYRVSPQSAWQLSSWIEDALAARTERSQFIENPREMMKYNSTCAVCSVTH